MKEEIRMMVYMALILAVVGIWGSASGRASNPGHLTDYPVVENGKEVINTDLNALIGKVVLVISVSIATASGSF